MFHTRKIPFVLLLIFLGLILIGINSGEVPIVLQKAKSICLGCMGIG